MKVCERQRKGKSPSIFRSEMLSQEARIIEMVVIECNDCLKLSRMPVDLISSCKSYDGTILGLDSRDSVHSTGILIEQRHDYKLKEFTLSSAFASYMLCEFQVSCSSHQCGPQPHGR